MATAEDGLTADVLALLTGKPGGLDAAAILVELQSRNERISPRGVRNLLNRLAAEGTLVRRRGRAEGPGAPAAVYINREEIPHQLTIFDSFPEITVELRSRAEVAQAEPDREQEPDEPRRVAGSMTALQRIAQAHEHQDKYMDGIIQIASDVASLNPVDLVMDMAHWVVEDLNVCGEQIQQHYERGRIPEAEKLATELDAHIGWTKRRLRRLWRLDSGVGPLDDGILFVPLNARAFKDGGRAKLDADKARERLQKRICGDKVLDIKSYKQTQRAAAGTDASVADITLEQARGSFMPSEPIAVMTAAAALSVRSRSDDMKFEYQDFDFTPEGLYEYGDSQAAMKGLIISPHLRENFAEQDFKHARLAAMDLRQYTQDERVVNNRDVKWRPVGINPSLGNIPAPKLIFRDGRAFPSVHRLKDFEEDGLYGRIVQSEIQTYYKIANSTQSPPFGRTVYGAVVKNPELSYLSPLIFWYLHKHEVKINGRLVVPDANTVYQAPFSDTAVSHLLFLGLLKSLSDDCLAEGNVITTFRLLRRFSDIAEVDDFGPAAIMEGGRRRPVDEDKVQDWMRFFQARRQDFEERGRTLMDLDDYAPFIDLCTQVGVSMYYAAPTAAYEYLTTHDAGAGGHFLLPRLENTVFIRDWKEETYLEPVLSWIGLSGVARDEAHTQTGRDLRRDDGLPVLVPDVIVAAHEAAGFSREKMSEEVQDILHAQINELRRWSNKSPR